MREKDWQILLDCANLKEPKEIPIALIVDSPWIPGYLGIPHMQFYFIPDIWLEAYREIKKDFLRLFLFLTFG